MATHLRTRRPLIISFLTFFVVGTIGTGGYVGLYWLLDHWWSPQLATVTGWFVATVATNLVHRHLTFAVTTPRRRMLDALVQFGTSLLGLGVSTALIEFSQGWGSQWHAPALIVGTGLAGILRFVCMKVWFDHTPRTTGATASRAMDAAIGVGVSTAVIGVGASTDSGSAQRASDLGSASARPEHAEQQQER